MSELLFHELTPKEYDLVYKYMSVYGEGSCQHSFVTMYALFEKYGDVICEKDGFLYTLRSHLCDEQYRVYLAPMGGGDLKQAFQNVIEDAHRYGKKVKFITLTQRYAEFVQKEFPDAFDVLEDRDLAEYVYQMDKIAAFSGKGLKRRRQQVSQFWRLYGARTSVTRMTPDDIADVLKYEDEWLEQNRETHDALSLEREARAAVKMLQYFEKFRVLGVVLRFDGQIRGFTFGVPASDTVFDALLEKGDINIPHVYKVLHMELAKECAAAGYIYENLEEDLGIPGLRYIKLQYQPDFLINKFVVSEK